MNIADYQLTTADLVAEFGLSKQAVRRRAKTLGIGLDFGGSVGFKYTAAEREKFIDDMRPVVAA